QYCRSISGTYGSGGRRGSMVARFFRSRNCGVRPNLNLSAVARAAAISLLFYLSASICSGEAQTSAVPPAVLPEPAAQIDLLPLGFVGLSPEARQSANLTV